MARPLLEDAFAHHVWATLLVIDACAELSPEQLNTPAPGTYGPILETMRHIVGADASYLFALSAERTPVIEEDSMDLAQLREVMVRHDKEWRQLLAGDVDPDRSIVRRRDDGSESAAPMGIRLAQVLHHGTDHRSQICTALTSLGVEPPLIDVWDYAWAHDMLTETEPTS